MIYEAVIGLEIHVELNCATKMFCDCPNIAGADANIHTCPICLWFPGAIPRFSEEALEKAELTSLGLNCKLQERSAFDQKVYYYPDLPKGYQLSQAHLPLARNGWLDITGENGESKRLRIRKIHMEEDVARLVHEIEGKAPISLVDFNRAGVPLVEIVTEPDMASPYEAMEFVRKLRTQIRYIGTAECSMEAGTMRVDANISLRPKSTNELNTKVEIKNMNSIKNLGDAIAYEINRQTACLSSGEPIVLHTRLWDAEKRVTVAMRAKFEGPCVPDPAVAHIVIDETWKNELLSRLPEMPGVKADRFGRQYKLSREDALTISAERDLSEYFEAVVKQNVSPRTAFHWLVAQLLPLLKERGQTVADTPVTSVRFSALLLILEKNEINANACREALKLMFESSLPPAEIIDRQGFRQVSDTQLIEITVNEVILTNSSAVSDFHNGADKAFGFLMGRAMQAMKGKGNPKLIKEVLEKKLRG